MLRVVKNISLNSFMLGYLPAVREKDLIIFSGAVKKVDMNRELKGEDDKLMRISSMTGDKECCAVLHADFIAGNGCFNSEASVEAWRKAASLLKHRTPRQVNRNHIGIVASEKFWCYQSFGRGRITAYSVRKHTITVTAK